MKLRFVSFKVHLTVRKVTKTTMMQEKIGLDFQCKICLGLPMCSI